MLLGLTRGEIVLVTFIFALIYAAGLLPKLAASLARRTGGGGDGEPPAGGKDARGLREAPHAAASSERGLEDD